MLNPFSLYSFLQLPQDCPDLFPGDPPTSPTPTPPGNNLLRAETYYYFAIAGENQTLYTKEDELFGNEILDPNTVSFYSLFVNAVLQPPSFYVLTEGMLIFEEAPPEGSPIIIQFIKIFG